MRALKFNALDCSETAMNNNFGMFLFHLVSSSPSAGRIAFTSASRLRNQRGA
jgi:hypothetical protein